METPLNKPFSFLIILAGMLLSTCLLSGQTRYGSISGEVIDEDFLDGLKGVSVSVEGVDAPPVMTDSKGRYQLLNIPAGSHTLVFSKKNYKTAKFPKVQVVSGELFTLHVPLVGTASDFTMDVIEITVDPKGGQSFTPLAKLQNPHSNR
jgi:hypothetical protein